jgi:hypothetical protein
LDKSSGRLLRTVEAGIAELLLTARIASSSLSYTLVSADEFNSMARKFSRHSA